MFASAVKKIFGKKDVNHDPMLTVLYGSHSGNSAFIAKQAKKFFHQHGVSPRVVNMARYNPEDLIGEKHIAIIVSTQGEGEPPESAGRFYRFLFREDSPQLNQLNFTVCALGDSSYEYFCQTGKDIDHRLEELGARRFWGRVDCDVEFQKPAAGWLSGVLKTYKTAKNEKNDPIKVDIREEVADAVEATILNKYCLNPGSSGEVYHIALSVDAERFSYEPGDSVSLLPTNPGILVELVLQQIGGDETSKVIYEEKEELLVDLLSKKFELTRLSRGILERYQSLVNHPALEQLLLDKIALKDYLQGHDLNDFFADFPSQEEPGKLISVFQKLQPRLYSIASSMKMNPGEVHLTVKEICYTKRRRKRNGACSGYLNRELEMGDRINIQLIPNELFRLPNNPSAPVIMIGAGTGVAPFRAFLQERESCGELTKNWLIFGEKHQQLDFLYQQEWKSWMKNNILTRLDVAFSRDQARKNYVQHIVKEKGTEIWDWLKHSAHIYICGSVAMGHEVRQAFLEIIKEQCKSSEEQAESYLQELSAEGRWHMDVY